MLLTEDQARTKWCPHSRYNSNGELASNRWKQSLPEDQPHALNPIPCRCIASECMAWRWDISIQELPTGDFWLRTDDKTLEGVEVPRQEARGFCGLAGKVE